MDRIWRAFAAEGIGTFALVFLCAGVVCAAALLGSPSERVTAIAVAQACAWAVALSATLPFAGGYLNPAVTITLWVLRRLDNGPTAGYLIAQFLGAALAGAALRMLFPASALILAHFGTPHVAEAFGTPTLGALAMAGGVEVVLTFLLTFVIFTTILDPRAPRLGGLGPGLTVGLVLAALILVGYPLTGACANPARAFGTALWEWTYQAPSLREVVLVYGIGPIVGALLAGLAYTYLLQPSPAEDKETRRQGDKETKGRRTP